MNICLNSRTNSLIETSSSSRVGAHISCRSWSCSICMPLLLLRAPYFGKQGSRCNFFCKGKGRLLSYSTTIRSRYYGYSMIHADCLESLHIQTRAFYWIRRGEGWKAYRARNSTDRQNIIIPMKFPISSIRS